MFLISEFKRRILSAQKNSRNFKVLAQEWLEYKKSSIKEYTYYNYMYIIEKYLNRELGKKYVKDIYDYNFLIKSLSQNLSPKTIRDVIIVLKAILKYYEEYKCSFKYKKIRIWKRKDIIRKFDYHIECLKQGKWYTFWK